MSKKKPITEEQAKTRIEGLKMLQEKGLKFPCPCCGWEMNDTMVRNAISRRADVYICSKCGTDEAMKDFLKQEPFPFTEWAMI